MKQAVIVGLLISLAFAVLWECGFMLIGVPASVMHFCVDFLCVFPGTVFLGIVIIKLRAALKD